MAFKRSFAVLFVLATSVLAVPYGSEHSCSRSEFYYPVKDCCLPYGGLPEPHKPPHGKSCPPDEWYWHREKSCCVPKHPRSENPPPPQCQRGYDWNKATQCCEPGTPTSTYAPHKPSETPKGGDDGHNRPKKPSYHDNGYKKRSATALCPRAYEACPVAGLNLSGEDYECLDTLVELRSCGGCASMGQGQDCTAIKGAWNFGCEAGSCAVYTCELGYKVAKDGKSCDKY